MRSTAPTLLAALLTIGAAGCEFDGSVPAAQPGDEARTGRAQAQNLPHETVAGEVARVHLESMLRVASDRIEDGWRIELSRYAGNQLVERRALRTEEARNVIRSWVKAPLGPQVTLQSAPGIVLVTAGRSTAVARDYALRYGLFSVATGVTVSSETSSTPGGYAAVVLWPNAEILVARPPTPR